MPRVIAIILAGAACTILSAWGIALAGTHGLLTRKSGGVTRESSLHFLGSSRISRCEVEVTKVNRFHGTEASEQPSEIIITVDQERIGWPFLALESGYEITDDRPDGWVYGFRSSLTSASGTNRSTWRLGSLHARTSLAGRGELVLPIQPIALGFAGNTLFFSLLIAPIVWRKDIGKWRARRAGRCDCGYPLQPFDRCPECGKTRVASGTNVEISAAPLSKKAVSDLRVKVLIEVTNFAPFLKRYKQSLAAYQDSTRTMYPRRDIALMTLRTEMSIECFVLGHLRKRGLVG